jgi:hypothetical protein
MKKIQLKVLKWFERKTFLRFSLSLRFTQLFRLHGGEDTNDYF